MWSCFWGKAFWEGFCAEVNTLMNGISDFMAETLDNYLISFLQARIVKRSCLWSRDWVYIACWSWWHIEWTLPNFKNFKKWVPVVHKPLRLREIRRHAKRPMTVINMHAVRGFLKFSFIKKCRHQLLLSFDFTIPLHLHSSLVPQVELSGTPTMKLLLGTWLNTFFLA